MMDWTKAYSGTVIWVSKDKSKIKVKTHGGVATFDNEGFKVGDEIMFILDPASNKPLRILPKDVALLKIAMIQEPIHQLALMEDLVDPFKPIDEEVEDDSEECIRHILEEDIDQSGFEPGEDAEEWFDFVGLTDPFGESDWDHN